MRTVVGSIVGGQFRVTLFSLCLWLNMKHKIHQAIFYGACPHVMDWPSTSPDLNLIEQPYGILKPKVENEGDGVSLLLAPCHTNYWNFELSVDIFTKQGRFPSHSWLSIELFWGESKCTLLYKLNTKCPFFDVVQWEDIIKRLQKCDGFAHF